MGGPYGRIAAHGATAAAFFFVLQRFAFNQSLEMSLVWAAAMGGGAMALAWSQGRR